MSIFKCVFLTFSLRKRLPLFISKRGNTTTVKYANEYVYSTIMILLLCPFRKNMNAQDRICLQRIING